MYIKCSMYNKCKQVIIRLFVRSHSANILHLHSLTSAREWDMLKWIDVCLCVRPYEHRRRKKKYYFRCGVSYFNLVWWKWCGCHRMSGCYTRLPMQLERWIHASDANLPRVWCIFHRHMLPINENNFLAAFQPSWLLLLLPLKLHREALFNCCCCCCFVVSQVLTLTHTHSDNFTLFIFYQCTQISLSLANIKEAVRNLIVTILHCKVWNTERTSVPYSFHAFVFFFSEYTPIVPVF